MGKNKSIFISAGDISGDIHAANLIKSIKKDSNYRVYAIGGNQLKKVADEFIKDIVNINGFGFFPIKQVFILKKIFKAVKRYLIERNVDKVILVDYYGFNIHVAKLAHELKIPVYYFVTPQVWASRKYRIKNIAKYVDIAFPILPFEKPMYEKENVKAFFEGNPLVDLVPNVTEKKDEDTKREVCIGLFAGSRKNTIKRHLPVILDTVKILKEKINAKFVLFSVDNFEQNVPDYITVRKGNDFGEREKIDVALCPSGTVSLENALMGIPMVVMYKLSWANYLLARMIVQVKYITLANILLNKELIPECIQHKATAANLAKNILNVLGKEKYDSIKKELLKFRQQLGPEGVYDRVAKRILEDNI
ncbi:lipid-A-disaccharide synthase [Candidatus Ruminimicrobiellum ovillum]|uniref:lipid-A-disaccharide synthase n=1 Tax=Candidatus Ruminimicrobiellum ovillum TaxID=1947927 RepID=UPI003559BDD0